MHFKINNLINLIIFIILFIILIPPLNSRSTWNMIHIPYFDQIRTMAYPKHRIQFFNHFHTIECLRRSTRQPQKHWMSLHLNRFELHLFPVVSRPVNVVRLLSQLCHTNRCYFIRTDCVAASMICHIIIYILHSPTLDTTAPHSTPSLWVGSDYAQVRILKPFSKSSTHHTHQQENTFPRSQQASLFTVFISCEMYLWNITIFPSFISVVQF